MHEQYNLFEDNNRTESSSQKPEKVTKVPVKGDPQPEKPTPIGINHEDKEEEMFPGILPPDDPHESLGGGLPSRRRKDYIH